MKHTSNIWLDTCKYAESYILGCGYHTTTIQFVCKDGTAILNPYYLYIAELLVCVLVQQVYFSIICLINSISSLIPITIVILVGYLNPDIEG
jgi:hypothetical protein